MATGWKPRCGLRIGVVGNRRFGDKDDQPTLEADEMKNAAAAALDVLWDTFAESISAALDHVLPRTRHGQSCTMRDLFTRELPRVAVLTSLAAGVDQIGARTALAARERRPDVAFDLEAILPFAEESYPGLEGAERAEFRPAEAAALRDFANAASQVIHLHGDFATEESRRNGYAQARDLLLQNSDVVVAIYDPDAVAGVAGTVESVGAALRQEIPVVAVLLSKGEEPRVAVLQRLPYAPDRPVEWTSAHPLTGDAWRRVLASVVRDQLVLPEALARDDDSGEEDQFEHVLHRLALVTGDARPHALCRNRYLSAVFDAVWKTLQKMARWNAEPMYRKRLDEAPPSIPELPTLEPYARIYRRASELAGDFMRTYRGAFVTSYLLAGLAVAAAVAMMAVTLWWHMHTPHAVMLSLCGVKIGILVLLLVLESAGHHGKFQEAGADFRYLAELLRPMQWLTPIGTYPPAVNLPLFAAHDDPRRSWMAWLARAAARTSPCVTNNDGAPPRHVSITTEYAARVLDRARTEWLEGQLGYHWTAAARMHILEEGLERLAKRLLLFVLIAAGIACIVELSGERLHAFVPAAYVMGALAAFLPAWIAAFTGIAFQSEAKRLAVRSDGMYRQLKLHKTVLEEEARRIRAAGERDSTVVSRATSVLKQVAGTTLQEAGDWKVLYQVHVIHAG